MERDLEPERVVVVDHPAAAVGQHPALGRAAAERRDDLLDVEAGLDGEDDAFGDAEVGAGEDHLVDGLDRLAGTDRADVGDRPAEGVEDRPGVLDVRARRRRRRSSAWRSARPRCRPRRARRPSRSPRSRSRAAKSQLPDGAMVEQSMISVSARAASATPSGPKSTASTSGVSETQIDDDTACRRRPRPVSRAGHAEVVELRGATRRPVPDRHREAGAGEVGGHRGTHRAEAEEGDLVHRGHGTGRRPGHGAARARRQVSESPRARDVRASTRRRPTSASPRRSPSVRSSRPRPTACRGTTSNRSR